MRPAVAEPSRARRGFTMIELAVTLSVIAILASMSMFALRSTGRVRAVDNALQLVRDMARSARAQAILAGQPARLIINYDSTDTDRFLRYVGIVVRDPTDSAKWQAVDRGSYLPQGVYVVPQKTAPVTFASTWPPSPSERVSKYRKNNSTAVEDGGLTNLDYPKSQSVTEGVGGVDWIGIQFAPNGSLDGLEGGIPPKTNCIFVGRAERSSSGLVFTDSNDVRAMSFKMSGGTIKVDALDLL